MPPNSKRLRVRVFHEGYGCDTGCCGHTIEVLEESGEVHPVGRRLFEFAHPFLARSALGTPEEAGQLRGWALELAQQVIRHEAPECYESIDWETIDVTEVNNGENC